MKAAVSGQIVIALHIIVVRPRHVKHAHSFATFLSATIMFGCYLTYDTFASSYESDETSMNSMCSVISARTTLLRQDINIYVYDNGLAGWDQYTMQAPPLGKDHIFEYKKPLTDSNNAIFDQTAQTVVAEVFRQFFTSQPSVRRRQKCIRTDLPLFYGYFQILLLTTRRS
jgi:hypothetical protein